MGRTGTEPVVPTQELSNISALPSYERSFFRRSKGQRVVEWLVRNGWTDVANVAGGTGEWERRGLPVNRGEPAPGEGAL